MGVAGRQSGTKRTPQDTAIREIREELGVRVVVKGEASFMTNDMRCLYIWYEADVIEQATPYLAEPHIFDDLQYWDITALKQRDDLSANLQNLLHSDVL